MFLGRAWRQVCWKRKGTDSRLSDGDPFEKKLNAHGVKIDFWFSVIVLDKSFILLLRISRCDGEIKAT